MYMESYLKERLSLPFFWEAVGWFCLAVDRIGAVVEGGGNHLSQQHEV